MKSSRLIVVLGMHRSGTSSVTRGLRVLGVDLGDRFLPTMETVNAKGFWEDLDLNTFNEEILSALDSSWYQVMPIGISGVETLRKKGYFPRAVELLQQKIGSASVFGFKDPRMAKLLPFWKEVFDQNQFDVSYVITVRHPLSVVKSLAKRDGTEAQQSYLLWAGHVITSLTGSAGSKRVLVDYDRLMEFPDIEIDRIAKKFNLRIDPIELQIYKSEFLDQTLRHTVYQPKDLLLDDACPPIVREMYAALLDVACEKTKLDDAEMLRNVASWVEDFGRLKIPLVLIDKLLAKNATSNKRIASLDQEVSLLDHEVSLLDQQLAGRDAYILTLVNSKSWRITKPIRWAGRILRGDFMAALDPVKRALHLNKPSGVSSQTSDDQNAAKSHNHFIDVSPIQPAHPVTVILPVYRGIEMTKRCILAAMPNILAIPNSHIIVINDASPDVGMQEMLEQLATQWPKIFVLLKNEKNLGFVGTVNIGFKYFPKHDAVLLNSDVIVPQDWLTRLIDEAYSRPDIGTVTPFSNNATICSFPYFLTENVQPFNLDVNAIDAVFSRNAKLPCVKAPTGVGFCMYIRRTCLDKVGYLNAEKFGRGYGEENDLCQRILKSGWLNIISPNIYAYHEGGVSFSSEKRALVDRATHVLADLHSNYHADVQLFIKSDPLRSARITRYIQLLSSIPIPKVLHVTHTLGGGVAQHINELAKYFEKSMAHILLTPHKIKGKVSVCLGVAQHADKLIFDIPSAYMDMVNLLKSIGISAVHFHHTLGHDEAILRLPVDLGIAHLLTVHDYYWLNANPTLTDENGKYFGFYSDSHLNPKHPLPRGFTSEKWQSQFRQMIESADCVIFPSNATKVIFDNVYQPTRLVVAPHIEGSLNVGRMPAIFIKKDCYTIGVLGAISREKGADVLEEVAKKASDLGLPLKFKLIGYAHRALAAVKITGPYASQDTTSLIKKHEFDVIFFPAQCPETYSYTLSYALDSGLPIIASAIGAFPERLSGRTNTLLIDYLSDPADLLDQLTVFIEKLSTGVAVSAPIFEGSITQHDFYAHDYMPIASRCLKTVKIDHAGLFDLIFSHITNEPINKITWRESILLTLRNLQIHPALRWVSQAIPYDVRRAIRSALSIKNHRDRAQ